MILHFVGLIHKLLRPFSPCRTNREQGVTGQPASCGFLVRGGITHFVASLEFSRQRVPAHRRSRD